MYHHSEFRRGKRGVDVVESCDLQSGQGVTAAAGVNRNSVATVCVTQNTLW